MLVCYYYCLGGGISFGRGLLLEHGYLFKEYHNWIKKWDKFFLSRYNKSLQTEMIKNILHPWLRKTVRKLIRGLQKRLLFFIMVLGGVC